VATADAGEAGGEMKIIAQVEITLTRQVEFECTENDNIDDMAIKKYREEYGDDWDSIDCIDWERDIMDSLVEQEAAGEK
jgi:hypothetical protein